MSEQSDEEILIKNYLLGGLDEETQEQVEERLLCDEDFAAKLSAIQDGLIDDYVFDLLPANERKSFEKNFHVSGERRGKILFARAMEIYLDERHSRGPSTTDDSLPTQTQRPRPLQFLLSHKVWAGVAVALVLLVIFLAPMTLMLFRSNNGVAELRAQRARITRRMEEINRSPSNQRAKAPASFEQSLQPTILREESGIKHITLADDIRFLNLKLALPQARSESYRALVLTAEDEELFAVEGLTADEDGNVSTVLVTIPSEFLTTGDYQIQLRGNTDGDNNAVRYYFRVIKK